MTYIPQKKISTAHAFRVHLCWQGKSEDYTPSTEQLCYLCFKANIRILKFKFNSFTHCWDWFFPDFIELVKCYVESINNGKIPSIAPAVEQVRHSTCSAAIDKALSLYQQEMEEVVSSDGAIEMKAFEDRHSESVIQANSTFDKEAFFDKDSEYKNKLQVCLWLITYIIETILL